MPEGGLIAKFFARIVLNADNKEAVEFEKNLLRVGKALTGITLTAAGTAIALKRVVSSSIQMSLEMKQFSAETGASVTQLQRWQAVADETNNSAKAVTESVKAIALNQEKIKLGAGNISGYQLLGIDPTQDPFDILEDLRKETAGLSQGMKRHVLSLIGVSKELIQVLELSEDKFNAIANRALIIPRGYIETINEARASIKEFSQALGWLKTSITVALTPAIKSLMKVLTGWIRANREGITKSILVVFRVLTRVTTTITRASRVIGMLIERTIGFENVLKILGLTILWINRAVLMNPVILFLTALLLILEDIWVYTQGGKSVLGLLFEKFPKFEEASLAGWKGLLEVMTSLADVVQLVYTGLEGIVTLDFSRFKNIFGKVIEKERKKFAESGFWDQPYIPKELTKPGEEPKRSSRSGRQNIVTVNDNRQTNIKTSKVDSWEVARMIDENNSKTYDSTTFQIPKDE